MSVDLSKIRPGDEVLVRGEAVETPDGFATVRVAGCLHAISVPTLAIVSHTPKALAVGDRVRIGAATPIDFVWTGRKARLVAIDGEDAWLCDVDGNHMTIGLARLERSDV
jgi:hypothetical protein